MASESKSLQRRVGFEAIFFSVGPIALACGFFPVIVFLFGSIVGLFFVPWSIRLFFDFLLQFILVCSFGFSLGFGYGFVVAMLFSVLVAVFHWSFAGRVHPRILVQITAGLTGYWCIAWAAVGIEIANSELLTFWLIIVFAWLGLSVTQHASLVGYRSMYRDCDRERPSNWRFGIKDLMIVTTWVSLIVVVFRMLPTAIWWVFLAWVLMQALGLAVGETLWRRWPSFFNVPSSLIRRRPSPPTLRKVDAYIAEREQSALSE